MDNENHSKIISKGQSVGYIRVSSVDQNTERQLDNLNLDKVFIDKMTGSTKDRPELQRMIEYVRQGDIVYVHSLDRLARNFDDLLDIINQLNQKGVIFKSLQENITLDGVNNNPMDMLILHIFGAIAQFNRSLIREAQREGIAKAKAKGKYKGRKPALSNAQISELKALLAQKNSSVDNYKKITMSTLATHFNVSLPTIKRYVKHIKD
ncbi:recombinase family protein [Moraxella nonliquefaciens]|jgi:DNA invertase Pin-like site-specific DNA recombinase|uniref:Recombinase family protein n=2 Tax=Moraxella nonliquefaciens TaxID=478 RepID=A0A1B8QHW3_MORNO|nr:recombinase family protein [Moraxella nonliquefaciens]OBX82983.1 transposase [Moraxella nonliquefaciens]QPT43630.1 recombinase family protein [Moraxella nonliquefaciens]QQC28832.1 recombinase family protein [Moraxella nonliquefaciens]